MDENEIREYKQLAYAYDRATQVRYSSPDQFQYRQNQLMHAIAKFLLKPYWKLKDQKVFDENDVVK